MNVPGNGGSLFRHVWARLFVLCVCHYLSIALTFCLWLLCHPVFLNRYKCWVLASLLFKYRFQGDGMRTRISLWKLNPKSVQGWHKLPVGPPEGLQKIHLRMFHLRTIRRESLSTGSLGSSWSHLMVKGCPWALTLLPFQVYGFVRIAGQPP